MTSDPLLDEYINSKYADNTRKNYLFHLKDYMKYTGKTCTELIDEAESQTDLPMSRRSIRRYLDGFKRWREEKGLSYNSVKSGMTTVRNFYDFYDVELPRQRQRYRRESRVMASSESLPSRDDIRRALDIVGMKYQCIILVQVSSGMGVSEVSSLKYNHFFYGIEDIDKLGVKDPLHIDEIVSKISNLHAPIIIWKIRRIKTGVPYFTFSTTETLNNLLRYLQAHPPKSMDSPLFPGRHDNHLDPKTVSTNYYKINKKLGFENKEHLGLIRSHNMRKWFATEMSKSPLGYLNTRRLLGHSVVSDIVGDTYIKPDINHLKFLYKQSMDYVTIRDRVEVHHVTDERFTELEAKYNELREIIRRELLLDALEKPSGGERKS